MKHSDDVIYKLADGSYVGSWEVKKTYHIFTGGKNGEDVRKYRKFVDRLIRNNVMHLCVEKPDLEELCKTNMVLAVKMYRDENDSTLSEAHAYCHALKDGASVTTHTW